MIVPWLCALFAVAAAKLQPPLDRFDWLIGTWRSEFGGKVEWPTIPDMSYGEEITFAEAPVSQTSGERFINVTSIAWSHNTKDHFHNEFAHMTTDRFGNVMYFGVGNNGFVTVEEGRISRGRLEIETVHVGRVNIARELPVEGIRRVFTLSPYGYLEQTLDMRTITHPHPPQTHFLRHAMIFYSKVK